MLLKISGYSYPLFIREGKNYKLFPKMKLALKVIGGSQMNIKTETKPSFKVAGVLKENIDSNQCPSTCFFYFNTC
ncbi:hypothetical protein BOVMAS02_16130 [Streptococcus uberis]